MRKISYTVPPTLDGSSVAAVLRSHGFSTALLRSLKKTYGALSRNGCPVRTVDPVHTGDTVTVELNTGGATAPPSAEKAVIVYADRDILVVNKRAGMAMYETYNHHATPCPTQWQPPDLMARSGPFTGWTRTPVAWWYWPGTS